MLNTTSKRLRKGSDGGGGSSHLWQKVSGRGSANASKDDETESHLNDSRTDSRDSIYEEEDEGGGEGNDQYDESESESSNEAEEGEGNGRQNEEGKIQNKTTGGLNEGSRKDENQTKPAHLLWAWINSPPMDKMRVLYCRGESDKSFLWNYGSSDPNQAPPKHGGGWWNVFRKYHQVECNWRDGNCAVKTLVSRRRIYCILFSEERQLLWSGNAKGALP